MSIEMDKSFENMLLSSVVRLNQTFWMNLNYNQVLGSRTHSPAVTILKREVGACQVNEIFHYSKEIEINVRRRNYSKEGGGKPVK